MKKITLFAILLISSLTSFSTTWTVTAPSFPLAFTPTLITITAGDSVKFVLAGTHDAREVSLTTWNANLNTPLPGGFQTPWSGGLVLPAQLGVGTHYYVCTPHAAFGMKARIIVSPAPLTATSNQTNVSCNGQCNGTATVTPNGGQSPYTYLWAPGGQTTATKTGMCAATYTCTVTDGGSATTTKIISITEPTLLTLSQTHTNNLCFGSCTGTVTLSANGGTAGYTYSGSTTNLCAGNYSFTVTDANGCIANTTATITSPTAIAASATATNSAFCAGGCTNLNISASGGTPGYTYLWMPGSLNSATPNVCPAATTTYTCTVTDANGCTQNATLAVTVNQLPVVGINAVSTTTCVNQTNDFLIGNPSGGTFSGTGVTGNNFNPSVAGVGTWAVTYTYTDVNGCSNSASVNITVGLCTGVNENANEISVNVFPNPSSGVFTVQSADEINAVEVYNMLGEKVYPSLTLPLGGGNLQIDLTSLANGIYQLQIVSDKGVKTEKIVIQK